jgi:hypothetical protein
MNYILETERLRLREFTVGDTKFIIELLNSPLGGYSLLVTEM